MGRSTKRLDKVEVKVEGIPVTPDALDQAFAQFISTGEPLCANVAETPTPIEIRVEGEPGMRSDESSTDEWHE